MEEKEVKKTEVKKVEVKKVPVAKPKKVLKEGSKVSFQLNFGGSKRTVTGIVEKISPIDVTVKLSSGGVMTVRKRLVTLI